MQNITTSLSPCPLFSEVISLHLERANYMRKPYALVSGIIKKSLQPSDGRKEGGKE